MKLIQNKMTAGLAESIRKFIQIVGLLVFRKSKYYGDVGIFLLKYCRVDDEYAINVCFAQRPQSSKSNKNIILSFYLEKYTPISDLPLIR